MVTPQDSLSDGVGVSSPRGGKKSAAAKKDLSKKATHNPEITMPKFSLDSKIQGDQRGGGGGGGGGGSSSKAADRAEKERAERVATEGVPLVVRAEASDLDIAGVSAGSAAVLCVCWFWLNCGRVCVCTECGSLEVSFVFPPFFYVLACFDCMVWLKRGRTCFCVHEGDR